MGIAVAARTTVTSKRELTLEQFTAEIGRQIRAIMDAEQRIVSVAAIEIHALLAQDTGVDTGEARSNWVTTVGAPWTGGVIPAFAPGRHLGKAETGNLEATKALTAAVVQYRGNEVPIFITNLAEHVGMMNEGAINFRPENAPINPGFIEAAIYDGLNSAGVNAVQFLVP